MAKPKSSWGKFKAQNKGEIKHVQGVLAKGKTPHKPKGMSDYTWRKIRAAAQGKTVQQARGHAPAVSKSHKKLPPELKSALKDMRNGATLQQAAKASHVAPERLRHFLKANELAKKDKSGKWEMLPDNHVRRMLIYTNGKKLRIRVNPKTASIIGEYLDAVRFFIDSNNPIELIRFDGKIVADVDGKTYMLETDPDVLKKLAKRQSQEAEEDPYEIEGLVA